jgi:hypothetical protein
MGVVRGIASVVLVCLAGAVLISTPTDNPAIAWSGDPTLNTVICAAGGGQVRPVAVGDGYSGTIVVWQDGRASSQDIYAQRIDPTGMVLWPDSGVAVCTASSDQTLPVAISDGHGGAIIAWQDRRSSRWDIYSQRIDPAGAVLWTVDGTPISTAPCNQVSPILVSDGNGGAIVIWQDKRSSSEYDIYAQKIDASGTTQWMANGVAVCNAAFEQTSVTAVSDSEGGAIIAWQDKRRCGYDIYAQRVDSSSTPLWAANGECICTAAGHQVAPVLVEDGCGGAIIAWSDGRGCTKYDVYGQRVNPAGTIQWTANGVPICTAAKDQDSLSGITDGSGGAIIVWQDSRSQTNCDIYGQRVDSTGSAQWDIYGVPICTAAGDQTSPIVVRSSANGAIIAWQDARSGLNDVYGQRVNSSGAAQWNADGVPICTAPDDQSSLSGAVDCSGGAVFAWQDSRNTTMDIYAQRVQASGLLCRPPNQPSNLSPADGEEGVSLTPILKCSAFSPGEPGDSHAASQWRMTATAGDYSNPVFDSGPDTFGLRQVTVEHGKLTGNATYYWQVRHQGSNGLWSLWSEETSFTTQNRLPDRPEGVWPENGATGIDLTPTLQSSAFSDPDVGDTHAASQWRVTTTPGDYGSPVFLSPELTANLIEVTVDSGRLTGHTNYYWQVRHQDDQGDWSAWSEETSFTTLNRPPDQPVGVWPEDGASGTGLTPTLQSSPFQDPDVGDTHAASQWRITTTPGDYSSPVLSTPELTSSLIQVTVESGRLTGHTAYYWQVRHQDNQGTWSDWSEETSFTTMNRTPQRPAPVSPPSGTRGSSLSPTLEASGFSDPDAGDTHAASQWQIRVASGNYSSPVFASQTDNTNLVSILVPAGKLDYFTTYFWHVQYEDNHGAWSEWSEEYSFTTQSAPPDNPPVTTENHPPERPVCTAPEDSTDNVSTAPTLESSAFRDVDADDAQAASQWQITTEARDYQDPTFDGFESGNYVVVSAGTLSPNTTYYWRVRHQDNHGAWSEWSEESSFTTAAKETPGTENRMTASSWIYLGIVAAVAILATAAVAWRTARANRMAGK